MTSKTPAIDISYRSIFTLTGPIFLANLAVICSGTIDTVMAGRLSPADMAGVALGMAVASFIAVSLSDVLQGLSPVAGYYFGARRFKTVGESLYQAIFLALIFAVPGVLITIAADFWAAVSGMEPVAAGIAKTYLYCSAAALPAILLSRGYVAVNAATSRPKITMIVTLFLVAFKIPVNGLFMYGWLGFPAMGGAGAGVSTAILAWGGLLCYMAIWHCDPFYLPMRRGTRFAWNWKLVKHLLRVGVPIGVAGCCEMAAFSAMTIFLARLGDVIVAAHQIVANLVYILYVFPFSVGIAGTVLVSQSLGDKKGWMARKATHRVLFITLVSALAVAAGVYGFREEIVYLYTDDASVAATAIGIVAFASLYHFVDGMQISATSLLRGYQITFLPMCIHAFMLCGVALSVGAVLCYTDWITAPMGLPGFWVGSCLGLGIAALVIVPLCLHAAHERARD